MKGESDSSLELLLDTMCNTFGGVMFIAITLAIALFARSAAQSAADRQKAAEARREHLLTQIAVLRKQLQAQAQQQKGMHDTMLLMEKDPRLKELKRLAILEVENKQNKLRLGLLDKELEVAGKELARLESKLTAIQAGQLEIVELDKQIEQNRQNLKTLEEKLNKTMSPTMSFTMLASYDDKVSYFLLLRKGRVWQIGPSEDKNGDGIRLPKDDVSYTVQGRSVRCVPKQQCGIPALNGKQLSTQLLELMKTLPADRGARFILAAEDASVFYLIREELKQQGIFHGFNMVPNTDSFIYHCKDQPRYEY